MSERMGTAFGITPDGRVVSAAHFGRHENDTEEEALIFVNEGCCRVVSLAHDDPAIEEWWRAFRWELPAPERVRPWSAA